MSSFDSGAQISHLTHLSGMIIGYLLLKKPIRFSDLLFKVRKSAIEYRIQKQEKRSNEYQNIEMDINRILDKINDNGYKSLTDEEQERLYKGSRSLFQHKKKD